MIKIMLTSTWNKGIERARQRGEVLFKTIDRLTRECDDKDGEIRSLKQKLSYAEQENFKLREENDRKNNKFQEYLIERDKLEAELEEARKNDQRDHLGRFVSAKELDANGKK
jgi:regulator of replication initiation timing